MSENKYSNFSQKLLEDTLEENKNLKAKVEKMNKVLHNNHKILSMCSMCFSTLLPYCNYSQKKTIMKAIETITSQEQEISEI